MSSRQRHDRQNRAGQKQGRQKNDRQKRAGQAHEEHRHDGGKRQRRKSKRDRNAASPSDASDLPAYLLLFSVFLGALYFVYGPALDGTFISDDAHYVYQNPYLHDVDSEKLKAILDPRSVVTRHVENYAPLHLLIHAAEWSVFGEQTRGYHVVNLVVHALASVLLALLLQRTGMPRSAAFGAAAIFLLHPANVEAVAWISQLKTTSAMVLGLLALLAHPRRPALAALAFGLALLAKPTAAVVLFVALVWGWVRSASSAAPHEAETPPWRWPWLAGWAVLLALFAIAELWAFSQTAGQAPPFYPELDVRWRTICAIALRYLVLAVSGLGTSTFHEPPAAESWLDPWWLGSLVVLGLLAWRFAITLRRRSIEAVYWTFALVSFAPICGVIPLPFPMADRYLYFILPGLLGALLFAGPELVERFAPGRRARANQLAAAACAVMLVPFALLSHARAAVWQSGNHFMMDAELHYPEGAPAKTRQATRAARIGDVEGAVAALRAAMARGYNRLDQVLAEPAYAPYLNDPRFRPIVVDLANEWIERLSRSESPSQMELRAIAQGYIVLNELDEAERVIRRAIEVGGPFDDKLVVDLENVERQQRLQRATRRR